MNSPLQSSISYSLIFSPSFFTQSLNPLITILFSLTQSHIIAPECILAGQEGGSGGQHHHGRQDAAEDRLRGLQSRAAQETGGQVANRSTGEKDGQVN